MNTTTTLFLRSDPAMYTSPRRTYVRVGVRDPARMCTYGRGLECLLVHTYGQGSCTWLGRNGETAPSSCSWGGNEMCRVHGEATECVVLIERKRNTWEPSGLDGTADGNEAWHTTERRKRPCVQPATFEMGSCSSGGVWRTAKRRKRTSYGRNGGSVDREGCGVPQNGTTRNMSTSDLLSVTLEELVIDLRPFETNWSKAVRGAPNPKPLRPFWSERS